MMLAASSLLGRSYAVWISSLERPPAKSATTSPKLKCRFNLNIFLWDFNTCEHAWDMRRGQACYQCLHQYKMKNDSNYKKNAYYNKLHEIKSTRFCKHNFDGHRGEGCPKCRDEDKIQNDSNYRINDSINGL